MPLGERAERAKKGMQKSSKSKADSFPRKKKCTHPRWDMDLLPHFFELRKVTEATIHYLMWKW